MNVIEKTAPSGWASYLINGDGSGLEDDEVMACDAWIEHEGLGAPVSCEDYGFVRMHGAYRDFPYAADCQLYTFLID